MKHYKRQLKQTIKPFLNKGRAIMIYGPRRVGKTTLVKKLISEYKTHTFFDCDKAATREILQQQLILPLKHAISGSDLVIIDEAQRVRNIGLTIKIIIDNKLCKQLIVTGSSSLELANTISEPLTGRKFVFRLFPLSFAELKQKKVDATALERVKQLLLYGSYPEVINAKGKLKTEVLLELAEASLYKDILEFQQIKNPENLRKLLQALAFQIGSEVSYTELASLVGVDKNTIERYVDLLEKSFIIFRLPPLSRNLRKEISKQRKIYFYDTGIRNALIGSFSDITLRNDLGALWENWLIVERIKQQQYERILVNNYFWRVHSGAEVDLVEEKEGKLYGYEFKWKSKKVNAPKTWIESYTESTWELVAGDNFEKWLLQETANTL